MAHFSTVKVANLLEEVKPNNMFLTNSFHNITLPLSIESVGGQENRPDSSGDFILNNSLHPCHPALSGWSLPTLALDARVHFYFLSKTNVGGLMSVKRYPQYPDALANPPQRLLFACDELENVRKLFNTLHRSILANEEETYHSDCELLILMEEQIDKVQAQIDIVGKAITPYYDSAAVINLNHKQKKRLAKITNKKILVAR